MKKDKSMIDTAYEALKERDSLPVLERAMSFADLFALVAEKLEMSEEEKLDRIGDFYSDLTFDGRFIGLNEGSQKNYWDLRNNHSSARYHIEINDIYGAEETDVPKKKGEDGLEKPVDEDTPEEFGEDEDPTGDVGRIIGDAE